MTNAARWAFALLVVPCAWGRGPLLLAQATADERFLRSDPNDLIESPETGEAVTVRTALADLEEKDVREAPASVQVITAEQIQASGARDLVELLRLVPGLSFGRDVDDVTGVGIHGNWAEEGKCLFLLNGLQLNENDFGTYSIGNRVPLDNVERIEIISGPGSVVHGGYAALGVINIITRAANGTNGGRASITGGFSGGRPTRGSISVSGRQRTGKDQDITYLTSFTQGNRSNIVTVLPDGSPISFADSTAIQTATAQLGYRWRDLQASMVYMDELAEVSSGPFSLRMRDLIFSLEQRSDLGPRTELAWKVTYADQVPWNNEHTLIPDRVDQNTTNRRASASTLLNLHPREWLGLRFGAQAFRQSSQYSERDPDVFTINGRTRITMGDVALLGEATLKGRPGILSAGYRYEHNSLSGTFMAPRASYAKVLGRAHVKVQVSRAFKVPTIMNINYGPTDGAIRTEYAITKEMEAGYRIGRISRITLNVYRTELESPIVYVYDAATLDNYINRPFSGTQGFDASFQLQSKRTTLMLGYGLYRRLRGSDLPEAELPAGLPAVYQALPGQRATGMAAWEASPAVKLRCRATFDDRTWAYQSVVPGSEELELVEFPSQLLIGLGIQWTPRPIPNLTLDLGCTNLLDSYRYVVSPYDNGSIPLRLNGREATFRLIYRFAE